MNDKHKTLIELFCMLDRPQKSQVAWSLYTAEAKRDAGEAHRAFLEVMKLMKNELDPTKEKSE
tara:strand:+ start:115 stop:303 length:189 start_codon:yes stop_codon:yes gene_type:complete